MHADNGQQTNKYLFDGLIEAAKPFAKEALQKRKARQKQDAELRAKKKPTVV